MTTDVKSPAATTLKLWLLAFVFSFSISVAIVHTSINTLSEDSLGGLVDARAYVASYYGEQVYGHWRYRVVTGWLARQVPDAVEHLLQRDPTPFRRAHIHFAFVNLGFLTATGLLLYAYLKRFIKEEWLGLLGVVIYLTSRTNIQGAGAPMVDPGAFFFLLLGCFSIVERRPAWLFVALLVGVFTKETTLLLWPLLWLSDLSWREKGSHTITLIPGTVAYLLVRYFLFPDPGGGSFFSVEAATRFPLQLATLVSPNGLVDWVSSFSLFWIPAIYAFIRCPIPPLLRRWCWLIPIVILMILFLSGNLGRVLFLSFVAVIPLALIGIREWMQTDQGVAGFASGSDGVS